MVSSNEQNLGELADSLDDLAGLVSGEIAANAALALNSSLFAFEQATAGTSDPEVGSVRELLAEAGNKLQAAISSQTLAVEGIAQYQETIGAGSTDDSVRYAANVCQNLLSYREAKARSDRLTATSLVTINGTTAEEPWRVDNSSIESYNASFAGVLPRRTKIQDLVPPTGELCVVDLMASTTAIRGLLADREGSGYALRLADGRTDEEKAADDALGIKLLPQNIASPLALQDLGEAMEGRKANILTARPLGGALNLPKHWVFYRGLIRGVWGLLHPEGGTALLETPSPRYLNQADIDLENWLAKLKAAGVESKRTSLMLRLTKTPDSPDKLPM